MDSFVVEHEERLIARIEDDHMVFEVTFDSLDVTDVTLRFRRDGEKVGSVYNDDGTERTMVRLTVPGESDFIGVEVPKAFVAEILEVAEETDRIDNPEAVEGYRLRMLRDVEDVE